MICYNQNLLFWSFIYGKYWIRCINKSPYQSYCSCVESASIYLWNSCNTLYIVKSIFSLAKNNAMYKYRPVLNNLFHYINLKLVSSGHCEHWHFLSQTSIKYTIFMNTCDSLVYFDRYLHCNYRTRSNYQRGPIQYKFHSF